MNPRSDDAPERYPPPARGGDPIGVLLISLFAWLIGLGMGLWWAA